MDSSKNILLFYTVGLFLISSISQPKAKATKKGGSEVLPYETVNNFCLYRRLDVDKPFCLKVLKNRHAANAKSSDLTPLLEVAINSTSIFMCKTLTFLQDLYEKKKSRGVEDCLTAYEEIAEYMTKVISDVSQESIIAASDAEVISTYISTCVEAAAEIKLSRISGKNTEAQKYAKLIIDIADGLTNSKPSLN